MRLVHSSVGCREFQSWKRRESELKPYNNTNTGTIEKKFAMDAFIPEKHPHTCHYVSEFPNLDCMFRFSFAVYLLSVVTAASLYGQFTGAVEDYQGIAPGRNGLSYQSRVLVELSGQGKTKALTVESNYGFKALDLSPGLYELYVNSYDFEVENSKWQIEVSEEGQTAAVKHPLGRAVNASSRALVDAANPLQIPIIGTVQYYENQEGGLNQILLDSPFGFIFKNRTYTTMFIVCLITMAVPYVLLIVNPELAEQINKRDSQKTTEPEVVVLAKPEPQTQPVQKPAAGSAKRRA